MEVNCLDLAEKLEVTYHGIGKRDSFHRFETPLECFRSLMEVLLRDSRFWCDQLISIAGNHTEEKIELHYHLASIPTAFQAHVLVNVSLQGVDHKPEFISVADLWKSANWHERETAELFGVQFVGHPDPRNLLLPANWEGFPLRKGYSNLDNYHGIKVKY